MDFTARLAEFTACDSVHVVVDRLSKSADCIPASSSITGAAWLFINHAWKLPGFRKGITTDRNPKFVGDAFMTRLTIDHNMTTANHPEAAWPEGAYGPPAHTVPQARCARISVCVA